MPPAAPSCSSRTMRRSQVMPPASSGLSGVVWSGMTKPLKEHPFSWRRNENDSLGKALFANDEQIQAAHHLHDAGEPYWDRGFDLRNFSRSIGPAENTPNGEPDGRRFRHLNSGRWRG